MPKELLVPQPQVLSMTGDRMPRPAAVRIELRDADEAVRRDAHRLAADLLEIAGIAASFGAGEGLPLALAVDAASLKPEGYRLTVAADGFELVGADAAGLFYGGQTLLQLLAFAEGGGVEVMQATDWPQFRVREWMVDMGRAPFSMPLLRRCVRICGRLKLNTLHLHLNDDQLCGLRFDRLPLGSENPFAMTPADLRQLVEYAAAWHVRIVPEWECWGHAGSVTYHYPHLCGGPGMWGGASFAIGEPLFELFAKTFDEIVPTLAAESDFHVGLDEAIWALHPSVPAAREADYTPETLVGRLHEILQRVGARHGRRLRMRLWADHGGRPIPAELAEAIVVEPWQYHECREAEIREKVGRYGGAGKTAFMCGGGISSRHHHGTYGATRVWAQAAANAPNCEGVDICMWETNAIADRLVGVYAGADYIWSPATPEPKGGDDRYGERLRGEIVLRMHKWQAAFPDAADEAIRRDTGYPADRGIFTAGPCAGRPVAPTVESDRPRTAEEAMQ